MSVILKKDSWKIKDPNTGEYRDSTVFASTFAEDTADIVAEATAAIDAQETRAAGIVSGAQSDIDTIAAAVQSMTETGTDTTLTISGAAADAAAVGELKTDFNSVTEIVENICYVTNGAAGSLSNVTYHKADDNVVEFYGTANGLLNVNPFNGSNEQSNSNSLTPTKYLAAGKYTVYFARTVPAIGVFLTESTCSTRTELTNGQTITVGANGGCVYVRIANRSDLGTSENPSTLQLTIYRGENIPDYSSAIDRNARERLDVIESEVIASVQLSSEDIYDNFYADVVEKTIIKTDSSVGKKVTKLIPIFGGSILTLTSYCNGAYGIIFFDKFKDPISAYSDSAGTHTRERTVDLPSGCAYFAATINSVDYAEPSDVNVSYKFNSVRYAKTFDSGYRIEEPYELLLRNKNSGKVLCIGDSLTESANVNDITYPEFMGYKTGLEYTNEGHSGYTSIDWWTNYGAEYTFTAYDAFIIWLGTNGQLTDTLENDVTPYSDYDDFANTNTGCYCKIISKIISQVPKAKIFLVGVYAGATTSGVSTTNKVINKIAELYTNNVVGVIDTRQMDIYNSQKNYLHPYDYLHFGKYGNFEVSEIILQEMRKLIKNNPQFFARYNSPLE